MTREVDGPVSDGRCSKGKTDGFCQGSVKVCTFFILEKLILIIYNTTIKNGMPSWKCEKKSKKFPHVRFYATINEIHILQKTGTVNLPIQDIQYIITVIYGSTNP